MRTRRVATGRYEVDAPDGTYEIIRVDADADDRAQGYRGGWYITWPGCYGADEITETLRDAKWIIANQERA